jgi:hypothetical protein
LATSEHVLASIPLKSTFYDRHERREYFRAVEVARRIIDQPSLVDNAVAFLDRHVRPDPHQAAIFALWSEVISLSPSEIARAMLDDSSRGAELRASAPVFVVLSKTPEAAI